MYVDVDDLLEAYEDVFKQFDPEKLEEWVGGVRALSETDPEAAAKAMAKMEQDAAAYRSLGAPTPAAPEGIAPLPRTVAQITSRRGIDVHAMRAAERRVSGQWDLVDTFMTRQNGARITLPEEIDMSTGRPLPGTKMVDSKPDAVSFARRMILDDKPAGSNIIVEHRQQMFRYIQAYRDATGQMPRQIVIEFYDTAELTPVETRVFDPMSFVPVGYK
jgi:hypothetical protein